MADTTNNTINSNQINFWGKLTAGILLTLLTTAAIVFIIAFWPNKMPPVKDGDDGAWYVNCLFNITLIEKTDAAIVNNKDSLVKNTLLNPKKTAGSKDSSNINKDSAAVGKLRDSLLKPENALMTQTSITNSPENVNRIHLNTILLLLVALMGFLGNMVHIATSLTTFVGMGTFQRSWVLWYFVKPFTAAGLAIILYFIIRAGFLSYGSGASGISLYGILALSALAGLFTDSATLKLKEVFEVIFKPKDERSGRLQGDEFMVATIEPQTIPPSGETNLVLTGKNMNLAGIKITIDGNEIIPATRNTDKLEIKYTPAAGAAKAELAIADKAGKQLYKKEIMIK